MTTREFLVVKRIYIDGELVEGGIYDASSFHKVPCASVGFVHSGASDTAVSGVEHPYGLVGNHAGLRERLQSQHDIW